MNRSVFALLSAAMISFAPFAVQAQGQTSSTRPTSAQAQAAMTDPAIRARIMAQVKNSGMSPDQIRTRLRGMGYSDDVINQIVGGAGSDTTGALSEDVFLAARSLGLLDSAAVDSLRSPFLLRQRLRAAADSALLDTLGTAIKNDTVRAAIQRLLASPAARRVGLDSGFVLFGRTVFDKGTTQFDPAVSGPLPPNYRIGFGDQFTLVLSGDIERTEQLTVTRDGWVVLRDAGQVPAANLTFEQLRAALADRVGRVYSGVRTGLTHVSVLPTKVGTNQVYVLGDVRLPNAYQISRLGTVLTALYAAGGLSENGDARSIDVKRNNAVIATMDLYDYLLSGSSAGDVRLENGDVVFVHPRGPRVRVSGAVVRPATYELKVGESLADAIRMAGGFRPEADRRRVQIERIVPPGRRSVAGQDKEVLDITSPSFATGFGPTTQRLESGDVVIVAAVDTRVGNKITVLGNVWKPTTVAFAPEMKVSDALAKASGLKPDTYLGVLQISRLQSDSTRRLLRVTLDTNYRPIDDIALAPDDEIKAYSLTEFRTQRYVTIGGAVREPKQVPYQEGMTLRDLILFAGGLRESALLTEAEIASLPKDRANRVTATTRRVPLDSSYLVERGSDGKYAGPPGIAVSSTTRPDVLVQPYDAVTILTQPDFSYERTVWITGEVKYTGEYALKTKDERLYDLIRRAGDLTPDAYPAGISFIRRRDSIGRIGVDLPRVLKNQKDRDNILLVNGDSIYIPPYSPIVTVRGAVHSPDISVPFVNGADLSYYISAAGGGTIKGDERRAYVVQPNGKVQTRHRTGLVFTSKPDPEAGSAVYVPLKDPDDKRDWLTVAQTTLSVVASLITVVLLAKSVK